MKSSFSSNILILLLFTLPFSEVISEESTKFTLVDLVEQVAQGIDCAIPQISKDINDPEHNIPLIPQKALDDVLACLENKRTLGVDFTITLENYRDYLNAAKYLDLTQRRSTFEIRHECLLKSEGQLKTLEAFSYRLNPLFFDEYDKNGKFLADKKYELYHAGQFEITFVPEWIKVQRQLVQQVIDTVLSFSNQLGHEQPYLLLFTGAYGSGKSYQVQHHRITQKIHFEPDAIFNGILGTDAIKRLLMFLTPGTSQIQVHHESVAIRLQIMRSLLSSFPHSTLVQEAVLSNENSIQNQFQLAQESNFLIKLIDLDADLETACLRILTRDPHKGDSIPHFRATVAAQKSIRTNRSILHQMVEASQEVEEYELIFSIKDQIVLVAEKKNGILFVYPEYKNLFLEALTPTSALEVEKIAQRVITYEDCQNYGHQLKRFIGMTIENALHQLSNL